MEPTRRLGVISDTHGLLRPEALAALRGVDRILHAGDIGGPEILERLGRIAPVVAVRGNNDREGWANGLPEVAELEWEGRRVVMIHNLHELPEATGAAADAVVSGHSHRPRRERRGSVLYLNPGSAGPRRFRLPVAVGHLWAADGRLEGEWRELPI